MITIGVDIGQKVDPPAVVVAELQWRQEEGRSVDYHVIRRLERLPLGTPYPQVATRLREIVTGVRARTGELSTGVQYDPHITAYRAVAVPAGLTVAGLYVDATGVGLPVVDLLRGAGVVVRPVYFTHGDRRVEQHDRSITLGKAWLVSRLQALLQTGRILLPRSAEAQTLAKELQDYQIKVGWPRYVRAADTSLRRGIYQVRTMAEKACDRSSADAYNSLTGSVFSAATRPLGRSVGSNGLWRHVPHCADLPRDRSVAGFQQQTGDDV